MQEALAWLNFVCLWLPQGTVALQINATAVPIQPGMAPLAGQNTVPQTKATVG